VETSASRCGKFAVKPAWAFWIRKQFGKPWLAMPCIVATPSRHFSVSFAPPLPWISAPPAGEAVDAAGCSLAEFCSGLAVPDVCNHGDWRNDEPLGNAQDCKADAGACLPRL
jgi:hypothetical protein